jgi:hypothetical protein
MIPYERFRTGGKVSVWIGNFSSDLELDDYLNLSRGFEKDFNFRLNERDMPESSVESETMPIGRLVDGFSWSKSYAEKVVEAADRKGIKTATTIVVFLNFEYDPNIANPNPRAPLQFLAAVAFS